MARVGPYMLGVASSSLMRWPAGPGSRARCYGGRVAAVLAASATGEGPQPLPEEGGDPGGRNDND